MFLKRLAVFAGLTAVSFLIFGCEGDEGPAGPEGTASCVQCHNDDTEIVAISAQWDNSTHATGGNFERNSSSCSRCHTSEGFVAYLDTGEGGTPENPSAIGCFTCHQPHTNYNFDLRISEAVVLDEGGATYDKNASNLCANCHQSRVASPAIPESGTIEITDIRWGPHHGPQANILSGNAAYEFAGESYDTDHAHYISDDSEGCVTCHMALPFGAQAGGHTWNMTYEYHGSEEDHIVGCETVGCHSTLEDFNYHEIQDSVVVLIEALRTVLLDGGILDPDDPDYALVPEGGSLTLTVTEAGALYNFQLFREDRSNGIHNPDLAFNALNASITAMGGM
jgi:hypothetical protein